jgi:hypothetical protein
MARFFIAIAGAVLFLGFAAGTTGPASAPHDPDHRVWEYTIVLSIKVGELEKWTCHDHKFDDKTVTYDMLNAMGKEGWELISLERERTSATVTESYFFKR